MTSKEALEDILLFMPKRQKEKQTEQIDILKSTIERLEDLFEKHEINSIEELDDELRKLEALRLAVKNLEDSNFLKRQELDKNKSIEEEFEIDWIGLFKVTKEFITKRK